MSGPGYFQLRKVPPSPEGGGRLPPWLEPLLPGCDARILDIGCGFGEVLATLGKRGFTQATGVDIDGPAVAHCLERGLDVRRIEGISEFSRTRRESHDLVLMLHVLEHLPKERIIEDLTAVRSMLAPGGRLVLSVPNAQSPTGCYWAYEDFTHSTIFTAGSLYHVLTAAGFEEVELVDPQCLAGLGMPKRMVRRAFMAFYDAVRTFLNRATASDWHDPSPRVYSWEVKAVARNP